MSDRPSGGARAVRRVLSVAVLPLLLAAVLTATLLAPSQSAHADDAGERARWDFTTGHAEDLSGGGHHGEVGDGVDLDAAGAWFDGTDAGEIAVPYAADYQPEVIAPGERWRLRLDDVVPARVGGDHRAIMSGRANDDGWIVYITPAGVIELWMAQTGGPARYARARSGVIATAGSSYDITAEWDGRALSIDVSGAATGGGSATVSGDYAAMGADRPLRFGNGGNAGTDFFFEGSIGAAAIDVAPLPPEPPAEDVCLADSTNGVTPVAWDRFTGGHPGDEASELLRDISLNATRYTLATWYPDRYGEQTRAYLDFGGTGELQIRGPAMAAVGAAVPLATGVYDDGGDGLHESEATDRVIRLVSSLAYRHRANSEHGWGGPERHWQTPLWAFYTGLAGWLLWDELTPAEQVCVQNMVEFEAERVPDPAYYRDRAGTIISGGNTQAEEDSAWASLLGLATAMLPQHEHWLDWQRDNVELLVAAYSRPADTERDETLNGRHLSEVLDGSNIENDGTVVNHGFLHPIYMLAFDQSVNVALTSSLAGQHTPEAAFHNVDVVYDALVDLEFAVPPYREPGGTIYRPGSADIYYPEGNDWGTQFPLYFGQADVIADVFGADNLVDPKASYWERLHNDEALAMQQRHPDGHTYADASESNYALREERITQMAGLSYLTRWLDHQDAVCVTSRGYTTEVSDAVLGELEGPREASESLRERADAGERAGDLTSEQSEHIQAAASQIGRLSREAADAWSAGQDQRLTRLVEQALSTVSRLVRWLESQRDNGHLSAGVVGDLLALTDAANAGLSTLHRCHDTGVSARLDLPDNDVAPGEAFQATAVVHNAGNGTVTDVDVQVGAPDGWAVERIDGTGPNTLHPGGTSAFTFTIEPPADVDLSWGTSISGLATYRSRGGGHVEIPIDAALSPDE